MKNNRIGSLWVLLSVSLVFLLIFSGRSTYTIKETTLVSLETLRERPIVLYFARNDCPTCRQMDAYLMKNRTSFTQNVYRIDTQTEPNQPHLRTILAQADVQSVPSFVLKEEHTYTPVKLVHEQNKLIFIR